MDKRPKVHASTVNRTQGLKIFSLALSQLSYRGLWYEGPYQILKYMFKQGILA